jgi:hypothetical protein
VGTLLNLAAFFTETGCRETEGTTPVMIRILLNRQAGGATAMPRWASWLVMAASFVIGVTLFLLAASLALILVPVVLVGGAVAAWQFRRRMKAAAEAGASYTTRDGRVEIVDAEYRIIDSRDPRP